MNKMISLAGMLVVLVLSYGLDQIFEFLRQENGRTFQTALFFTRSVPLDLAFAALILAFGWFFLLKNEKSAIVSVVFLIGGLFLLFSWPLRALFPTVSTEFLGQLHDLFFVSPTTFEFHAAAFVAVTGAAGMIRWVARDLPGTRIQTAASKK